jgi:hypothetical protein
MPITTLRDLGLGSGSEPGFGGPAVTIGDIGAGAGAMPAPSYIDVAERLQAMRQADRENAFLGVYGPRSLTGPARGSPAGMPEQARDLPPLALTRERVARELENNPDLARKFDINTTAEVGMSPDARRKYQASVIDRAVATGVPLGDVVGNPSYYPPATTRATAASGYGVDPALWEGANPANFATGNASFDPRTGRWVGFAGGPQTATSGSGKGGMELYGIENTPGWREYAQYVGYTGPERTAIGPGGPSGGTVDNAPLGWQSTVSTGPNYVPESQVPQGATTAPEDLQPAEEKKSNFMSRFLGALGNFAPPKVATIPPIQYSGPTFRPAPISSRNITGVK